MKKLIIAAAAIGLAIPAAPVFADDHMDAEMETRDQTWLRMNFIKFEPGHDKRIGEILEMFGKADEASGNPHPVVIHMNTGEWDMVVVFRMKHGIEQMGWKSTPEGDAWDKAFYELAGGEEAGQKIFTEFSTYVAREESHIAHRHPENMN